MKALEISLAVALLAICVWGLLNLYAKRRRLRAEVLGEADDVPGGAVSPVLAAEGFTDPIRTRSHKGARGVFDGVTVHALSVIEWSPSSVMEIWALAIPRPKDHADMRVSAAPQGVRRKRGALTLGIAHVDSYLDVTGDLSAAQELFSRAGAGALVDAISVRGWRLVDGRLVREKLTADIRATALAGAAAARVLHDS